MPSVNELQGTENKSQDKLPLKDIEAESGTLYEGLPRLSTKEAYAIAKSRGFEGLEASFRSGIGRSPNYYENQYGIVKVDEGSKGSRTKYIDLREL